MRVFIGIKLDEKSLIKIKKYQDYLYSVGVRGNYTSYNNIHMTLAFIGEVNNLEIEEIKKIINEINKNLVLKFVSFEAICTFKDMIVIKIKDNNELIDLYHNLCKKLQMANFVLENRKFFGHVTLVRETKHEIGIDLNIKSDVNKIVLFQSCRINNNLIYKELN